MKQKGFVQVLVLIVVVAIAGYFAFQYYQLKSQITPQSTSSPVSGSILPTAKPTSQPTVTLPTGWSYKSDACNVRFPIPPKEAPYYKAPDGRFWDFPRGASYPNLLSKLLTGNAEYKQASAMYATAGEASGYVASAVIVSCINNTGKLDNQGMLNALKNKLSEFNQNTGEKGMEANKYTIQSTKEVNKWGNNALSLTISEYFENSGGQPHSNLVDYVILATPQYLYEVKVFGALEDNFVIETGQKIFDNLQFE